LLTIIIFLIIKINISFIMFIIIHWQFKKFYYIL